MQVNAASYTLRAYLCMLCIAVNFSVPVVGEDCDEVLFVEAEQSNALAIIEAQRSSATAFLASPRPTTTLLGSRLPYGSCQQAMSQIPWPAPSFPTPSVQLQPPNIWSDQVMPQPAAMYMHQQQHQQQVASNWTLPAAYPPMHMPMQMPMPSVAPPMPQHWQIPAGMMMSSAAMWHPQWEQQYQQHHLQQQQQQQHHADSNAAQQHVNAVQDGSESTAQNNSGPATGGTSASTDSAATASELPAEVVECLTGCEADCYNPDELATALDESPSTSVSSASGASAPKSGATKLGEGEMDCKVVFGALGRSGSLHSAHFMTYWAM